MPKSQHNHRKHRDNYKPRRQGKSIIDGNPTLITYRYHVPNAYFDAVHSVINAYKSGLPFNKAVDQVAALHPHTINRNKLAEHVLRTIANDF